MTKKNELKTVGIDECYPNTYNANKMSEKKFAALLDTIKRNGQTHPIQVVVSPLDKTKQYKIVGGEHKWRAMKALKFKEVDILIRKFEDDVEEQLGSLEDNLHGSTIPVKEAMIIASASKKYSIGNLERRLGEDTSEIKDKLLLAGEEKSLKKLSDALDEDHFVEMTFVLDIDPKQNADRVIREMGTFAKKLGVKTLESQFKKSKTKEAVFVMTFSVSDLQKNVVESAIKKITKQEDVTRSRALELMSADYLAGTDIHSAPEKSTKKKKQE